MDLSIRPIKPEEIPFSYTQSQNDNIESGCIGFLRGDFDTSGKGFYTTWEDKVKFLKTDEFKREFDDVINSLRFGYGELLKDRSSLSAYCHNNPDGVIEGNYTKEYGFRVDTDEHSYILRCNPTKGDYNFYVYAYDRDTFEKHLNEIGGKDMGTEELKSALYDMMHAEQQNYREWLMKQQPEEILSHTYEFTVREDILVALEQVELSDNLMKALMDSPSPLQEVYEMFADKETDYMQTLRDTITETAEHNFEVQAESKKMITVLTVRPGEEPTIDEIDSELENLQELVGGYIETIYPYEDLVGIICREEAESDGLLLNRTLYDEVNDISDIVAGTFFVVGLGEQYFCSLTDEQIEKYSKIFASPETFFVLDGKTQGVPYNDPSKYPLYEKPFSEARDREEISAYRLSSRADNMCKTAIEAAINDSYSDSKLDPEGAKKVVENFGIDRVKKIIALTCIVKDYDGRISPENKAWAKTIRPNDVKDKIDLSLVIDNVNPGLTDIFVRQVKRIETERSEKKPSVLKKLESAKDNIAPASTAPKKKDQVL